MLTPGQRLKELRVVAGMSQERLAQAIGVSRGTVAAWELGRNAFPPETGARLAKLFRVSFDYLMGVETPSHRVPTKIQSRLRPGRDDDIMDWLAGIPETQRSEAVRKGLRKYIRFLDEGSVVVEDKRAEEPKTSKAAPGLLELIQSIDPG